MPKPIDVMIGAPLYQQQQEDEVSKFLKVKPMALGILEILIALLGLGLTLLTYFYVIWAPIIFLIIGAITVSAAHTRKPRLVKSSQMLSYLNFVIASFSMRFHFMFNWGVPCFILMSCDILIIIFSIAVAATTCSCCCKSKSRPVMVNYIMGQPGSTAEARENISGLYMLPTADGHIPAVPLQNYSFILNASPQNQSPVPATPPPSYEQISAPLQPYSGPVPSAPPQVYQCGELQARR